jgi:hypothetical protein
MFKNLNLPVIRVNRFYVCISSTMSLRQRSPREGLMHECTQARTPQECEANH